MRTGLSTRTGISFSKSPGIKLNFDAQIGGFTSGNTITQYPSGATATVLEEIGGETLTLTGITGTFQDDEIIYESALGSDLFDANKGTFTEASLLGAEAITAQNDRDFSSGNIGNWVIDADGSGTCTYNITDIGGADDKQGLLTSDGDGYLQAVLPTSEIGLAQNTLYKFTVNMYVPAGNTLKNVMLRIQGLPDNVAIKTQTLSGDTWTPVEGYFYIGADTTGEIRVGFYVNPADGDLLYFDDISIKPIDISWVPYSINTIEIDSDALKITYVDNANGASLYLRDSYDLSSDLTVGKHYKLTGQTKVGAGDSVNIRLTVGIDQYVAVITSTTFVAFEFYFTAHSATAVLLRTTGMAAGEEIWLDNLVLKEVTNAALANGTVY